VKRWQQCSSRRENQSQPKPRSHPRVALRQTILAEGRQDEARGTELVSAGAEMPRAWHGTAVPARSRQSRRGPATAQPSLPNGVVTLMLICRRIRLARRLVPSIRTEAPANAVSDGRAPGVRATGGVILQPRERWWAVCRWRAERRWRERGRPPENAVYGIVRRHHASRVLNAARVHVAPRQAVFVRPVRRVPSSAAVAPRPAVRVERRYASQQRRLAEEERHATGTFRPAR